MESGSSAGSRRRLARRHLAALVVVALAGAALILPRLGHRQIVGSHEAVFPIVARDIIERHAWFGAELRGRPYRNKPPLYPWAIAAASWSTGRVTERSARVPGACAAIGAALVTCALGARLFGTRAGLWAALMLLTSLIFFDHAVLTIPDVPMVLFDLVAGLALWGMSNGGGRRATLTFYLALALAVFTKGIPGMLPLAVAIVWLAVDGGRREVRRLVWLPGIAIFAVLTAVWLLPYAMDGRARFGGDVVWKDWLWNPLGVPRLAAVGTQIIHAALGFLPWTLVLPVAMLAAVRARRERPVAFVLCWLVVQAALVFLVQQQRFRYLLPLLPGAALLVAWWAEREASAGHPRRVIGAALAGAGLAGALGAAVIVRCFEIAAAVPSWEVGVVLAGIVVIGALAGATMWTGRAGIGVPAVIAVTAIVVSVGAWALDDGSNRAWNYRAVADGLRDVDARVAVAALADDHELLQLDFYLGRALPPLRSIDAVAAHLGDPRAAIVIETARWRTAAQWLPRDAHDLHARPLGADVVVVTDARP